MRSLASTRMRPTIGGSLGVVLHRDFRSSFSPSFSLPFSVSLIRLGSFESGSTMRVTNAYSLLGLGVVSLSSLSGCRSRCICIFLSFISLRSPELPRPSTLTPSPPTLPPPFPTKQTPHTPFSWPTRVLARTPVCMVNTLMLEFARPTTSHDLPRAKEVRVDGMASSGLASEGAVTQGAMRERDGGKTGARRG